ncbi:MAG: HAD family phosphatase [Chloroflexi bacterium]|nr:HAD family phosphatase [Chloroflexota bacterium]
MIEAIIFDLDGTLVQSEKLKAEAYAIAVQRLRRLKAPDSRAIEAYRAIVGASREVASQFVIDQLGLEPELRPLMAQYEASEPWQVLTQMRTTIYNEMVADPQVFLENQWPHTVGLLRLAKETGCRTGLATMSYRDEVDRVLRALDLERSLDLVLAREDVEKPKPDPEIYLLAARRLEVSPVECLVVEDSPNGVRAAVAAGMNVIAFATPFTIKGLHESKVLEHERILHDSDELLDMVGNVIQEHERKEHGSGRKRADAG